MVHVFNCRQKQKNFSISAEHSGLTQDYAKHGSLGLVWKGA